jgi:MSHA biogenesis protein MshE
MARPEKIRLGDLLIQQGLLTQDQLKQALEEQKLTGRKLGRVFVDAGFVTEVQICEALARQLQAPFFNLQTQTPKAEFVKLLPENQARRLRALVLGERNGALLVGFVDPTDLAAYDEAARITRRDIALAVIAETHFLAAVDRVYTRAEEISGLAQELTQDMAAGESEFADFLGLTAGADEAPVVKLLNTVFEEALRTRASDIHVEPQESQLRIRFRIDGVLYVQMEADAKIASAVALRLKLMSGLDISEKRLPQDGRFNATIRGRRIDVRISTMPTQFGESVVMRLLNQNTGLLSLEKMQIPQRILDRLRHAIHRPSGLILVTGPTGSGKTTTLYAALSELNTPDKKIITVEDPVEYRLPGLNQVQVHEKIDLSFGRVLRTALRQDPDIVLVGEMRDQTTAEIGMRAAMTGHLVLSTLHTNDALSTPIRLLDMGVPSYMVGLAVNLVLAQRLVRTICTACSEVYQPTASEREWLTLELGQRAAASECRHGRGCTQCSNSGYQGRTGVYEMIEMTDELVAAINHDDAGVFIAAGRRQMAGETLRRDAVRLVVAGRTTIDEAMRISASAED